MPLEWIDFRQAARLHFLGMIAYACGEPLFVLHGGINAISRRRSTIEINSIIATHGTSRGLSRNRDEYAPPLNNRTLFRRDANLCLYCGMRYMTRDLTRDHITPVSRGGTDSWTNVATACRRCNNYKGGRTPEQASMQLIAVPFTPNYAEYIYLQGRSVLADQMEFLRAHFPRNSPLHKRAPA